VTELRRALLRQVISPPACASMTWRDRLVIAALEGSLVFLCLSLVAAVLRMCEP
jgi:hypothetical protein